MTPRRVPRATFSPRVASADGRKCIGPQVEIVCNVYGGKYLLILFISTGGGTHFSLSERSMEANRHKRETHLRDT